MTPTHAHNAHTLVRTDTYQHDRIVKMLGEREYWLAQRDDSRLTSKRQFCQRMADMYVKRIKWYLR